jgi:hypothetical protein
MSQLFRPHGQVGRPCEYDFSTATAPLGPMEMKMAARNANGDNRRGSPPTGLLERQRWTHVLESIRAGLLEARHG